MESSNTSSQEWVKSTFRDRPIKQKLTFIITITTLAALILAGIGILVSDTLFFRRNVARDLNALAQIVSDNVKASLLSNDQRPATSTLNSLKARPHLVSACIYRPNGELFAEYLRPGSNSRCGEYEPADDLRITSVRVYLSRSIISGHRIGTLVLVQDLGQFYERLELYGSTVFGVMLVASFIAIFLAARLQSVIVDPIRQLANTAISVSKSRDYSLRAQKPSRDELGTLVDAFNEMLSAIQSRDNDLRHAVSEREDALREAQNTRESLETTLASIADAVISTDVNGQIVFANRVARSLLRSDQLVGRNLDEVLQVVNELTGVKTESPVSRVLREGSILGLPNHTILIANDGTQIPIDESGAPIRVEDGKVLGTVLVFRDVSARRSAEAAGRMLASIVESSEDAIIGHSLSGVIISWNRGAERIFGYSAEEAKGRSISLIAPFDRIDEMTSILERVAVGEHVAQYHSVRRTKSGKNIDVSITVSTQRDSLGRIVGASTIARDISEQMRNVDRLAQMNLDLRRTNDRLARSNEDLERFAFVASHDLQEPLRMISIYSQLLLKAHSGEFHPQAQMYVDNVIGGTKRMRELLGDLLTYAEIGARPDEPIQPVDLNEVLELVKENLKISIDDNAAEITADHLPSLHVFEGHFVPLFQNLIGNAIKYRSALPPSIHISVRHYPDFLRFAVADNGIGIAPEYHLKIFVPFKRLHGKKIEGTGIGLSICQRVVERYGGKIWVESSGEGGSVFLFDLPIVLTSGKESPQPWTVAPQKASP